MLFGSSLGQFLHVRTSMRGGQKRDFQNFLRGLRGNVYFPREFPWKVKGGLVEIGWWKSTPLELEMYVKPKLVLGWGDSSVGRGE